ncbi:MAG: tetratricopeptide repeat protein, partial [Chloroflexi bacterium]|nr:tetratricopeptide repeat protein [Chloroflexota bacterium]
MPSRNRALRAALILALLLITAAISVAQDDPTIDFTLFRSPDTLTVYVPAAPGDDVTVNLYGLNFQTGGGERFFPRDYQAFTALNFQGLTVPTCLILRRAETDDPLPQACQQLEATQRHIAFLTDADVFWYDESTGTEETLIVQDAETIVDLCPAGAADCPIRFPYTPPAGGTSCAEVIANREVVVLIARFEQISGSHDEARATSEAYCATIVIWGNVRFAVIESFYTFTPRWSEIRRQPGATAVSAVESLDELALFVSRDGGDVEYIFRFVVSQLIYFEDQQAALPFLETALELAPEGREAEMAVWALYFSRGYILSEIDQDYFHALIDYNRVIDLNPMYPPAYNNRGLVHAELGKYDQALADFDRAIDLDPADVFAHNNRGLIHAELSEYDQAFADFD